MKKNILILSIISMNLMGSDLEKSLLQNIEIEDNSKLLIDNSNYSYNYDNSSTSIIEKVPLLEKNNKNTNTNNNILKLKY